MFKITYGSLKFSIEVHGTKSIPDTTDTNCDKLKFFPIFYPNDDHLRLYIDPPIH